jgi:hypothetical protein
LLLKKFIKQLPTSVSPLASLTYAPPISAELKSLAVIWTTLHKPQGVTTDNEVLVVKSLAWIEI